MIRRVYIGLGKPTRLEETYEAQLASQDDRKLRSVISVNEIHRRE